MSRETPLLVAVLGAITAATVAFGSDTRLLAFGVSAILCVLPLGARPQGLPSGQILIFAVLALGVISLGQVFAGTFREASADLVVLIAASAVFVVARSLALTTKGAVKALQGTGYLLLGLAIIAFLDHVTGGADIFGRDKTYHGDRLTGFFLSANTAATMMVMSGVFGTGLVMRALSTEKWRALSDRLAARGVIPILLILFSVVGLFLTGSRGGTAIGLAGIGVTALWSAEGGVRAQRWVGVGVLVVTLAVLFFVSRDVMLSRLDSFGAGSTGRDILWPACWQAFLNAPLFGHGLGNFREALLSVTTADNAAALVTQGAAHNLLLQWLVQTGIVGSLAGGLLIFLPVSMIFRGLRRRRRLRAPLKATLVLAGCVLAHGMIDYALEIPAMVWWFSLFLGLGAGIADGRSCRQGARAGSTDRRTP